MKLERIVLSLLLLCGVNTDLVFARVSGTAPANPDSFCVFGGAGHTGTGITADEDCIDWSGNFIPTVTNAQTIGTASLNWGNVYSQTVTAGSGGISNTGTSAVTGQSTLSGRVSYGVATSTGLGSGTTIPVNSSFVMIVSTGLTQLITATPTVSTQTIVCAAGCAGSAITDGTILIITSTATQTITLQDEGTLTGSKLQLGAATRAIGQYKILQLIFSASDGYWREVSYGNN